MSSHVMRSMFTPYMCFAILTQDILCADQLRKLGATPQAQWRPDIGFENVFSFSLSNMLFFFLVLTWGPHVAVLYDTTWDSVWPPKSSGRCGSLGGSLGRGALFRAHLNRLRPLFLLPLQKLPPQWLLRPLLKVLPPRKTKPVGTRTRTRNANTNPQLT